MKLFWCKTSRDMVVAETKGQAIEAIIAYWMSSLPYPVPKTKVESMLENALAMNLEEYTGYYFTTIENHQDLGDIPLVQETKFFTESQQIPEYVGKKFVDEEEIFCDECLEFWVENEDHRFHCDNCGAYNCNRQAEAQDKAYDYYRDKQYRR